MIITNVIAMAKTECSKCKNIKTITIMDDSAVSVSTYTIMANIAKISTDNSQKFLL